jgi:2-methylisocitrate lyase-like PEP mutase family enzyme
MSMIREGVMAKEGGDRVRETRRKFRALLKRKKLTVMPGGFSPLYARLAEEAGFECFFLPGSQLAHFLYGVPDNGIIGLRDLVDHARHMAAHCDIPILVDADTGYGNAVNVYFAVQEIMRSGVAALQIEDQEAPKKSGTAAGRRLIPVEEAVGKIKAAVAARDALDPDFVICARCDGIGAEGSNFADTLKRCVAYVKEGGADLVWLNSVQSREQVRQACKTIPGPVLGIWGGEEAPPGWEEYEKLGLRVVLYPTIAATAGLQASWELLNDLHARGAPALLDWNRRVKASPFGQPEVKKLLGYDKILEVERRYLPKSAQRDYATTFGHKTNFADAAPTKRRKAARSKQES